MAFVFRVVLALFFVVSFLSAYEFVDVKSPFLNIKKSGYVTTSKHIPPENIANLFYSGDFKPLPRNGVSFGFDDKTYYFAFLIDNTSSNKELFLELKSQSTQSANLYIFKDGNLIKSEKNGYLVLKNKREVQDFPIRFLLDRGEVLYVVEVSGKSPKFSAFAFGEKAELDKGWYGRYLLFFSTLGIFSFVFLFCIIFFMILKDTLYLYYALNNLGLFGAVVITQGYAWFFGGEALKIGVLAGFFIQLQLVGLVLFSEKFLEIKTIAKKLSKTLQITLYASLALSLLLIFDSSLKIFSFIFMVVLFLMLIFCAFLALRKGFSPALYYLLATGVSLLFLIGFTFTHQGVLPYNFFTFHLLSFALLWEMVFFTLAIAKKVRVLQQESIEKERILSLRSKRESLGELSGNIAHQWRTPLAEMGAIISGYKAKLQYQSPTKEEGVLFLDRLDSILKHLSATVETFQGFFQTSKSDSSFCVYDEVERTLCFIADSLKNNGIKTTFKAKDRACLVRGNPNEFAQALLAIVLNAKDILIERGVKNAQIEMRLLRVDDFVLLEIEDNGGGVRMAPSEKIFNSFVSDREGGIGVGLFIAKTAIEKRLGGTIGVANLEFGACFSIKLPIRGYVSPLSPSPFPEQP
ncbi:MAG: 7TM diverse intracellular signaling domain-containing protein [Campylobacterales bacterium]